MLLGLLRLHKNGIYREVAQGFCVLTNCKSVGVMGDGRTYDYLCGIRLVSSTDYMTADWYRIDWEILARYAPHSHSRRVTEGGG